MSPLSIMLVPRQNGHSGNTIQFELNYQLEYMHSCLIS
ncbi:hypothetical protein Hbal_2515 [Hirschia baltica ATCC 49814]|uniref:Uncharacterized protein n=1 Tax=Hirschia baltica (strain ATCC 49814 / DSM 5838 / IFAM 1418) TaxID=582402 RepID=C6XP10_HIRBI|nr:hypothetical protein Hbal_2515 [Hirschia baltica ATCC 49814]